MNRNILTIVFTLVFIVTLNSASAAPIWTEIGSSGTLDSSAENVGVDDNLIPIFGTTWGPYGDDEWARYSWGTTQRVSHVMIGGLPHDGRLPEDVIVEYSVENDGNWTAVPDSIRRVLQWPRSASVGLPACRRGSQSRPGKAHKGN